MGSATDVGGVVPAEFAGALSGAGAGFFSGCSPPEEGTSCGSGAAGTGVTEGDGAWALTAASGQSKGRARSVAARKKAIERYVVAEP